MDSLDRVWPTWWIGPGGRPSQAESSRVGLCQKADGRELTMRAVSRLTRMTCERLLPPIVGGLPFYQYVGDTMHRFEMAAVVFLRLIRAT
jgi:hypothetical protein